MNVKVKNRVNKSTALYLAALSMSFFAEMTQANMSVYPMELNVDSSGTAQIRVASKSDDIQFIRVRQKRHRKKKLRWQRGKTEAWSLPLKNSL